MDNNYLAKKQQQTSPINLKFQPPIYVIYSKSVEMIWRKLLGFLQGTAPENLSANCGFPFLLL